MHYVLQRSSDCRVAGSLKTGYFSQTTAEMTSGMTTFTVAVLPI